jgi:hypothetical protein
MFDAYTYFESIRDLNKITNPPKDLEGREEYQFCRISDSKSMEEVLDSFKSAQAYFAVDDTNDGETIRGENGGFFERRVYVVYLLKKYDIRKKNKMDLQRECLLECRSIYRDICSKLLLDKPSLVKDMVYLHSSKIPYFELPGYMVSGLTGLYFMVTIDQPISLLYDSSRWNK